RVPALPGAAPRAVDAELRGRVRALGRVRRGADRPRAPPPELWRGGPRLGGGLAGGPGRRGLGPRLGRRLAVGPDGVPELMARRAALALVCVFFAAGPARAQPAAAGRRWFESACARCHGGDGNGGEKGPGIVARLSARDDEALAVLVRGGLPAAGMPAL